MKYLIFFIALFSMPLLRCERGPIEVAIVIPSYNNEAWVERNLTSCAIQTYPHWHLYYINDCSQDRTKELVEEFIHTNHLEEKATLINNPERRGAVANIYNTIHTLDPTTVVIIVDGDDRLLDKGAVQYIADLYAIDPELWLTWGSFVSWPDANRHSCCAEYPKKIVKRNAFRKYKYVTGHLRTFYAGLYHLIKKEDLLDEDGKFLPSAGDVATMLPMCEMASKGHFRFVKHILYEYNNGNPLNDFRRRELQKRCSMLIRSRPPYTPLKKAPWMKS
jgi:glycosyltransferase involved in cell wall biosynthesis